MSDQKYYQVKSAVAIFRRQTESERTGVPKAANAPVERIDAGYFHYGAAVPDWATPEQITHNLECNLIKEVTEEQWRALPTDTSSKPFVRTPEDEREHQAQIVRSYN